MRINKYIIAAATLIFFVFLAYFINFYIYLDYKVSDDSAIWSDLGGYAGGILGPLLSFVSIVLLIKSLTLQNEANATLRSELANSEKTEKIRSFEALFFNMIETQKNLFNSFRIKLDKGHDAVIFTGVESVLAIEDVIESMRDRGSNDQDIGGFLEEIDTNDQIFGLTRSFYIIVMMITEKLESAEDRKSHFKTLVNFTDFSQLRLIMICIQFMDFESVKYLKLSVEFRQVIEDFGMGYELY